MFNVRLLRSALAKVQEILDQIDKSGETKAPPMMSPSSYLYEEDAPKKGDKVAAKCSQEIDLWILASFVGLCEKGKYEVEDEDIEERSNTVRKRYKLPKNRIFALPKVWDEDNVFEKGQTIFAVFPETTAFYPAIIEKVATASNQFYNVRFDDDEDSYGNVPHRKISFKNCWDGTLAPK